MTPDCCRGTDPYLSYDLTITDFKAGKERTVSVIKNSGDYIALSTASNEVSFTTTTLLTDTSADEHIQQHFSTHNAELLTHRGGIICLGPMTLNLTDDTPTPSTSLLPLWR